MSSSGSQAGGASLRQAGPRGQHEYPGDTSRTVLAGTPERPFGPHMPGHSLAAQLPRRDGVLGDRHRR